jgi:hypothetical protein
MGFLELADLHHDFGALVQQGQNLLIQFVDQPPQLRDIFFVFSGHHDDFTFRIEGLPS